MNKTTGVILASGSGERFGSDVPKQFVELCGKRVVQYSIDAMRSSGLIDCIILVCHPDWLELGNELAVDICIAGGATRNESSEIGLNACPDDTTHLLIQDAARPFLTPDLIERSLKALEKFSAVSVASPVVDTIYKIEDGVVIEIPPRENLFHAQTPQAFDFKAFCEAFEEFDNPNATDDLAIALAHGMKGGYVEGSAKNIKITKQTDLALAEKWISEG